jgi:DNA-binding NarL/FixJ family response regulator
MIRVLCVEDDPLTRKFITARLTDETDISVVAAVSDLARALIYLRQGEIDVVLLDYQLQGLDGIHLLEGMFPWHSGPGPSEHHPAVLFCTGFADEAFEARVRMLAARGVVAKERLARDLIPAVRAVAGGGSWFGHTTPTLE